MDLAHPETPRVAEDFTGKLTVAQKHKDLNSFQAFALKK